MISLDFKGPYHSDKIDSFDEIKKGFKPADGKGIYIWGFMFKKENELLGDAIDFKEMDKIYDPNKMQFIPYYVGQGNGTSIFNRLNSHSKPRNGHSTKYVRLSMNYMKSFFIDNDFPIKFKRKPNKKQVLYLIKKKSKSIDFFNNEECLREIYSSSIIIKNWEKQ